MIISSFKKMITPGLASKLGKQIYHHKSVQRGFHEDILCSIQTGYPETLISASLKTGIPNYGFHSDGIIKFYKTKLSTVEDGLNTLTSEVSKSKLKYPQFNYFRGLKFLKVDAEHYLKNRDSISTSEIEEMVVKGSQNKSGVVAIYELFSSGAWCVSKYPPWNYGITEDDDGLFDQYGEPRV